MISLIFILHLCFNYFSIIFNDNGGNSMTENYYLISDQDMHMPIRCSMQRFDHIRQQMHDFFEISMIVSGNCTLQLEDHMYSLSADDVFCVNPLTLHELHGVNCVIVTILFNQTLFEQNLPVPAHPRFFCVSTMTDQRAKRLHSFAL